MNELTGQVAIVTGAGRGIGRAVSVLLGKSGCRVILAARSESQLKEAEGAIRAEGGEASSVITDLTRDSDIDRLVQKSLEKWGTVDILINNAGWGKKAPIVKANLADWDQTLKINLRAPMLLTKAVLPSMIAKKAGAVINIGSIAGTAGEANAAAYAASKFGLIGFTQSLFEEVREHDIKAAVILPGFVDTPLIPPSRRLDRAKMIHTGDVARAVYFVLTSPATSCPVEITLRPQRTPYR